MNECQTISKSATDNLSVTSRADEGGGHQPARLSFDSLLTNPSSVANAHVPHDSTVTSKKTFFSDSNLGAQGFHARGDSPSSPTTRFGLLSVRTRYNRPSSSVLGSDSTLLKKRELLIRRRTPEPLLNHYPEHLGGRQPLQERASALTHSFHELLHIE